MALQSNIFRELIDFLRCTAFLKNKKINYERSLFDSVRVPKGSTCRHTERGEFLSEFKQHESYTSHVPDLRCKIHSI